MPRANIERAIERGSGKGGGEELVELVLEGYGPGGMALVIVVVTDNRNRTVAEIKAILDKSGGSLAEPGSVMYQFTRAIRLEYQGDFTQEEELALIELGVDEFLPGALLVEFGKEQAIRDYFQQHARQLKEEKVVYIPRQPLNKEGGEGISLCQQLMDHDDVQEVYHNG